MRDGNDDEISCGQRPCMSPRKQGAGGSMEDVNDGLKGRPVLYTGVVWIGIVRRFLIPRTCGSQAQQGYGEGRPENSTPRTVAHLQEAESALLEPPLRYKQKPQSLTTEQQDIATGDSKFPLKRPDAVTSSKSTSPLKTLAVQIHDASTAAAAQARVLTGDLTAILREGQETTAEALETVRSEAGRRYRLAAVSASGLVGYLVGMRRGAVTRVVYSATGVAAMATLCYPENTQDYNRRGLGAVRSWVEVVVALVKGGPQTPFAGGDRKKNKNLIYNEDKNNSDNTEPLEINTITTENIVTNLKQNLSSLGHHLEEIKASLKESSSKTVIDKYTQSAPNAGCSGVFSGTTSSALENISQLKSDCFEDISSKNDADVLRDLPPSSIPYSPALPVPPKVNSSQSKLDTPFFQTEDNVTTNIFKETSVTKKKSSNYFKSEITEEQSIVSDGEDNVSGVPLKKGINGFPENTIVIPTGGLEEKLEGRQEYVKKTAPNKNAERPLSKRLTEYYSNMPEEEKTSREKGYDDAYSNRGKYN